MLVTPRSEWCCCTSTGPQGTCYLGPTPSILTKGFAGFANLRGKFVVNPRETNIQKWPLKLRRRLKMILPILKMKMVFSGWFFRETTNPKNHGISNLVVWRSQTPAKKHIQTHLFRTVQWFLGKVNCYAKVIFFVLLTDRHSSLKSCASEESKRVLYDLYGFLPSSWMGKSKEKTKRYQGISKNCRLLKGGVFKGRG